MKPAVPFLIAALSLTGCASMAQDTPSCSSKEACVVTVKVSGCSEKEIVAEPDVLKVKRGYSGDILWRISGPDKWEFAENGIAFKDEKNPEFTEKRRAAREFRWYDKNTKPGPHRYNINLKSPDGKTCSKDPTIMNGQEP